MVAVHCALGIVVASGAMPSRDAPPAALKEGGLVLVGHKMCPFAQRAWLALEDHCHSLVEQHFSLNVSFTVYGREVPRERNQACLTSTQRCSGEQMGHIWVVYGRLAKAHSEQPKSRRPVNSQSPEVPTRLLHQISAL
eukprot:6355467-Amphidinium_carterae.2